MSFDNEIRQMIRQELQTVIAPIADAVAELQQNGNLASQLTSLLGGGAVKRGPGRPKKSAFGRVVLFDGKSAKRGPGRPRKVAVAAGAKRGAKASGNSVRGCAIIGCDRPARSKGYCAADYQKRRMLVKTKRLPADWYENAAPHSVKDLVLPRGSAGAKALAEAKK